MGQVQHPKLNNGEPFEAVGEDEELLAYIEATKAGTGRNDGTFVRAQRAYVDKVLERSLPGYKPGDVKLTSAERYQVFTLLYTAVWLMPGEKVALAPAAGKADKADGRPLGPP